MIEDIEFPNVKGVKLAIARQYDELNNQDWHVYLLNRNPHALSNVMVVSKGYEQKPTEDRKVTSTLRHHIQELPAESAAVIEKIQEEVFPLCNEFWISYYAKNKLFDKKFVFMPGSITEEHLISIEDIGLQGVLHS